MLVNKYNDLCLKTEWFMCHPNECAQVGIQNTLRKIHLLNYLHDKDSIIIAEVTL